MSWALVAKADSVVDKISPGDQGEPQGRELVRTRSDGEYGWLAMEAEEPEEVAVFLASQHTHRPCASSAPTKRSAPSRNRKRPRNRAAGSERSAKAACKRCGSEDLAARSGQYGYYWKCGACDENTAMPVVCSACGAKMG